MGRPGDQQAGTGGERRADDRNRPDRRGDRRDDNRGDNRSDRGPRRDRDDRPAEAPKGFGVSGFVNNPFAKLGDLKDKN
ncbi:MAG: hypothetical protein K8M05_40370 [Deltaproteobacteria bacterium]|nr:hypothetical protein [Kofleriaceae bacterium]